ncbi:MAG: 2'-5' RNA ligase family protein [Chitinophagales bacterium]|nr:2'-5' RNA ligase family protein [Chitinophagales bacterium]
MKQLSSIKSISFLALVLFTFSLRPAYAQSDIVAIDVLLNPDQTMLDSAKAYNLLMQRNYSGPGSYSLDELHTPHITVLQCFVKKSDLEKVYDAVSKVVKNENPMKEKLSSKGFYYFPTNDLGLAGITIDTTPALMRFQARIIEKLRPFIVTGTNAAFIQNADGTPIAKGSDTYVNGFIPDHSGAKYNPHVTIGLAHQDFLKGLLAKPYNKFTFKCASVSIYHLGDFGTARTKLWSSGSLK